MTLPLGPDMLRAAYDFLNETPPFRKWNLPDGEDIEFKVVRDRKRYAWHRFDGEKHVIGVSSLNIGQTQTLIRAMAHEMVHVHEQHSACSDTVDHGRIFVRLAAQVCKHHGFDPKDF